MTFNGAAGLLLVAPAIALSACGGAASAPEAPVSPSIPAASSREPSPKPASGRLPPEVIQRIVRAGYDRMRKCYEAGLGRDPKLTGRVTARFVIGRDGAVKQVEDGGSDMPDELVASCVFDVFWSLKFPEPQGGIVTVVYPIMFEPADS